MTITQEGMVLWVNHNHLGLIKINGLDVTAMEYRARQICALPKMVELLKRVAKEDTWTHGRDDEERPTERSLQATAILREIGELE